ncbi:hypothetical protein H2201_007673 [Coniosporium apollinis]|uniref:Centrosomin N-terminal motif 1 domain-containing protein n=1 Tax=Coniosporium apollinis TaxID=61459 RepID=A0ABQ9NIS6_9PEZI|nr:hypothetical protein H2201_007673 [Coniosporium apollinis]
MDRSTTVKRKDGRPSVSRTNTSSSPAAPATPVSQITNPFEERVEPKSDYLRKLLAEKREKAARQSEEPETPKPKGRDDWIFESDDEDSVRRSWRARRGSDRLSASRSPSVAHHYPVTSREHQERLDRLQKENFDIKLRFQLQEEHVKKLERKLDEALEEAKMKKDLEHDVADLVHENDELAKQVNKLEKEVEQVKGINAEVTTLNDDLFDELTKRDSDLGEATDMVLKLETEIENLKAALAEAQKHITPRQSSEFSGYYSSSPQTDSPARTVDSTPAQAELDHLPDPPAKIPRRDIFSPLQYDPRQPRPLTLRMKSMVSKNSLTTKKLTTRASFCSSNADTEAESDILRSIPEVLERTRISHPSDQHWRPQNNAPTAAPRSNGVQHLAPAPALAHTRAPVAPAMASGKPAKPRFSTLHPLNMPLVPSLSDEDSSPETPTPLASHHNRHLTHQTHSTQESTRTARQDSHFPSRTNSFTGEASETSTPHARNPNPYPEYPYQRGRPWDEWDIFSNRDDSSVASDAASASLARQPTIVPVPPSIDEDDSIYDVPTLHTAGFMRGFRGVSGGEKDVGRNFFFNGY